MYAVTFLVVSSIIFDLSSVAARDVAKRSIESYMTTSETTVENPMTMANKCWYMNMFYEPGRHRINECSNIICEPDGQVLFDEEFCPDDWCDHQFGPYRPECCPICQETTAPPPTLPSPTPHRDQCYYNDSYYEPGQIIRSEPCSSIECDWDGNLIYGDVFCSDICSENTAFPPECCPHCQETTTPTMSPTPHRDQCYYEGKFYEIGQTIRNDPCSPIYCGWDGYVIWGDVFCSKNCSENLSFPPQCCPDCQETTTPSTVSSTPDRVGCWYGNRFYEPGQTISSDPCSPIFCDLGGYIIHGDIFCSENCSENLSFPPECCPECQVSNSTTTPLTTYKTTPKKKTKKPKMMKRRKGNIQRPGIPRKYRKQQ